MEGIKFDAGHMYLGNVSWGNNHKEETGVTAVRPKNKETGDNEHRLPHKVLCCKTTLCNNTGGWKKADFNGRLTTQSKSLPRVSNYCGKKKSSYIIRRILPILNPVLGSPPVAQAYFERNVAV